MKRISYTSILLIVAALFSLGFTGCIKDDGYYDPQPQQPIGYQYSFNEDFTNDTRGWAFDRPADSVYAMVTGGKYRFVDYSIAGGYQQAVVPTGANVAGNFSVQTRLQSNYGMALVFGASNSDYGYSFFIDEQGYFAVYKEGSPTQTIINWQQSSAINTGTGASNDVEIEQLNGYWNGYINGVQVFHLPSRYLSGSQFGFMVLPGTTGYADYLTVKW